MHDDKLDKTLGYIESHLDNKLNAEEVSAFVGLSQFHFQRLFKAYFGFNFYDLIKNLRLKRAAYQLAYREDKIIDIALNAHYQSPEAFSRAFLKVFDQTPSAFRQAADWSFWQKTHHSVLADRKAKSVNQTDFPVEIVTFESMTLAYLRHKGDPALLGQTIRGFIDWRKTASLPPSKSRTFNLLYHDPNTVPASEFRFDIACEYLKDSLDSNSIEAGLQLRRLEQGRFLKARHIGSDDELAAKITSLYRYCLAPPPDSLEGEAQHQMQLRDFPLLFERVRFFPDVAETEAITDIYLAVQTS
ncbi:AraC family transcriptional regulator [Marinomonas sp. PE14-40]|uniref:AraC family transcriptional regulator n=1 Tax=Marinomonas sp. PE14-40 TaxID=3060621 RepID=UPI003F67386A